MDSRTSAGPPDQASRERIVVELDRNLLVEAAAGTGKTTSMVGRMVALLREGRCRIDTLAAVTFTRKAAAELRSRFQVGLERAAREECDAERRQRLEAALSRIGMAFIGTIHSFCARLLRERPVEAGVDPAFEELDDAADLALREQAWQAHANRLHDSDPDDLLRKLDVLGLAREDLKSAFFGFANYPDVVSWPKPDGEPQFDLDAVATAASGYAARMRALWPELPEDPGNDRLMPMYRRIPRIVSHLERTGEIRRTARLVGLLTEFDRKATVVQRNWPGGKDQAKAEQAAWDEFRDSRVRPILEALYERRYGLAIALLQGCEQEYSRLRREQGRLNYQDLLLGAAALLRDRPHVRRYFQQRFTHLLVDEFQDTDPIQAEVVLLLTAADPEQHDWRHCRPRPGSLFVVGDPKQSIYRFRRADIVTYNDVRDVICADESGAGGLVHLTANFRCSAAVREWVNRCFAPAFPEAATEFSPSYVALEQGRADPTTATGPLSGVSRLTIPRSAGRTTLAIVEYEADRIARAIQAALGPLQPSDFMIIARRKRHLSMYANALARLDIPHRVTGGTALNEVVEIGLLLLGLQAVIHPDDPVALVAALRSELFGVSDVELYELKRTRGSFDYRRPLPEGLDAETATRLGETFALLQNVAHWIETRPLMAAVEHLADELGLMPAALSGPSAGDAAGGLARALELLRSSGAGAWTVDQVADHLSALASGEEPHDAIPATTTLDCPAVQIMNLHKAKGLEAPVVFLADPTGRSEHPVTMHVDRTAEGTRGFLAMGYGGGYAWRTLAQPRAADWQRLAAREREFLAAEDLRLDYVAATRAGQGLVISQRESSNGKNPWQRFGEHLHDAPELPDPGPIASVEQRVDRPAPEDVAAAMESIAGRRAAWGRETYAVVAAKEQARKLCPAIGPAPVGTPQELLEPPSEIQAADWGTVIHQLLELASLEPEADLGRQALLALKEQEMDESLADLAVSVVEAAIGSEIWQRAEQSEMRLNEVPFHVLADGVADIDPVVPTLLRGCIDLVFREQDGWVVVDFKTDRLAGTSTQAQAQHHAPQVTLYARAWERITGEPVKEQGLLFTSSRPALYVPV